MGQTERYQGSLKPLDYLTPPEGFIPGLKHIYVVVGSGCSDIGKGWLSSSIASIIEDSFIIKIDPMLNQTFPSDIGSEIDGRHATDDFNTYRHFDLPVSFEQNLVMGDIWKKFLDSTSIPPQIALGHDKKLTSADFSGFVANNITELIKNNKPKNVVIEVGGIPSDIEHNQLPAVFRQLELNTLVKPELVVLSYFENVIVSNENRFKVQIVKEGLNVAQKQYVGLPLKGVFVRRNQVPQEISETRLNEELQRIAYETQVKPEKFVFLDDYNSVDEEKVVVEQSKIFKDDDKPPMVSACILGIPCRYNGQPKPVGKNLNSLLTNGQAYLSCPELLAGLSIPRGPFEISGGTGEDVLNGKAKVVDINGVDYSHKFIEGAIITLRACLERGITKAYLKEKSPSCGVTRHEKLDGTTIASDGVTTALLKRWGIECVSSDVI